MERGPLARGQTARLIWMTAGMIALGLGLIGIVLPLLPTTVFLLVAAFCFARGSERLHNWLTGHPRLGPPIAHWHAEGAISRRAKWASMAAFSVIIVVSVALRLPLALLAVQILVLSAVAAFILSRPLPSGDRG